MWVQKNFGHLYLSWLLFKLLFYLIWLVVFSDSIRSNSHYLWRIRWTISIYFDQSFQLKVETDNQGFNKSEVSMYLWNEVWDHRHTCHLFLSLIAFRLETRLSIYFSVFHFVFLSFLFIFVHCSTFFTSCFFSKLFFFFFDLPSVSFFIFVHSVFVLSLFFFSYFSHGWNFAILYVLRTWHRQLTSLTSKNEISQFWLKKGNIKGYMFHKYICCILLLVVSSGINFPKKSSMGDRVGKKHEAWQQSESDRLQK